MDLDKSVLRLKEITEQLEDSSLTVEQSIKLFEEASQLTKDCYKILSDVKGKITVVKKDLESFKEENFN